MRLNNPIPRRDFLQLSAGAFAYSGLAQRFIDPRDTGAQGDGHTLNTNALQKAIDQAATAGGGVVVIPPGDFLSGGLVLRSHVTLHLEAGAILRGSPRVEDYEYRPGPPVEGDSNGHHLLFALDAEDIAITGHGTIDGGGSAFWHRKGRPTPRPEDLWGDVLAWDYEPATQRRPSPMIELARCRNVRIEGVTLTSAPGWTLRPVACETVLIRGIRVRNPIYAPNTDGMDITACRNVFVSDCDIATGDDAICIKSENPYGELLPTKNITITNCVLSTCCNGFKVGTSTHGRVENIVFSNSVIYNESATPLNERATSGIALEVVDGGSMSGILISNIQIENARTPLFVRLGRRKPAQGSFLRGIRFEQIHATGALLTTSITGLPDMPVEDVVIANSSFRMSEHGSAAWTHAEIPEYAERYPEARMFGRLPASGVYVRHAREVRIKNTEIRTDLPEERPAIVCDDVHDLELCGVTMSAPSSTEAVLALRNTSDAFIQGARVTQQAASMLHVSGASSRHIVLSANDLSRVSTPSVFSDGASAEAIVSL
ncbi:glycoside hydrolase family 28 protein [Granulicella mallensis]|uniref:Polygalacturonase n=1 Tax=Granulicella mallensis TaxID=940614 RepID=A0A7W7ZKS3_9BACT|nr:glycoside hydrolase family 28 protein [Granulicella mallensis]MBB5061770.1 polygalacturonase [Granulicella mallensis]